jgi:hypothetical protein
MRTRIFWNHQTGERFELSEDRPVKQRGPTVMPDLDGAYNGGFRSPINGEFITSRSQLRAHEQRYDVKQCGDFKPGEVAAMQNQRVERQRLVQHQEEALQRARAPGKGVRFQWQ